MSDSTDNTGNDAEFAEWVRTAARDYHEPPAVPREAMWSALQARHEATVVPIVPRATPLARPWRAAALAAAAMLIIGITFEAGRRSNSGSPSVTGAADSALPAVAQRTPVERSGRSDSSILVPSRPTPLFPPSPVLQSDIRVASRNDRDRSSSAGISRRSPAPVASVTSVVGADTGTSSLAYGSASAHHLARAEALLAGFRAADGQGGDPAADAAWATDLLITTRLLLDSPAAHDPDRRRLFEALELVLVQIARLPRAGTTDERSLIDRAIERGDLMTRLRATPARPLPSGT